VEGNPIEVTLVVIVVGFDKVVFTIVVVEVERDLVWKAAAAFAMSGHV